jgi:ribulose-phosphate 3-epimerase
VAEQESFFLSAIGRALSVGIQSAPLMKLAESAAMLEATGVRLVHFDVMDGRFVPSLTVGPAFVKGLATALLKDVHLEIQNPLDSLEEYAAAGADIISVHPSACAHAHRTLQRIGELTNTNDKRRGVIRGVALNPSEPLSLLEPLLDVADLITLVAVNPGFKGQSFIAATIKRFEKIAKLAGESGRKIATCIDGGVTAGNFDSIAALGPDIIVTGSAIFASIAPAETIAAMQKTLRRGVHAE